MKYRVSTTKNFEKIFQKLTKKNNQCADRIISVLEQLENDPFYKGLYTHKVRSKNYGIAFSSRVTGNIRIIWSFIEGNTVILALTVGGHSGGRAVY